MHHNHYEVMYIHIAYTLWGNPLRIPLPHRKYETGYAFSWCCVWYRLILLKYLRVTPLLPIYCLFVQKIHLWDGFTAKLINNVKFQRLCDWTNNSLATEIESTWLRHDVMISKRLSIPGLLWWEFTGHLWFPLIKRPVRQSLDFLCYPKQAIEQTVEW